MSRHRLITRQSELAPGQADFRLDALFRATRTTSHAVVFFWRLELRAQIDLCTFCPRDRLPTLLQMMRYLTIRSSSQAFQFVIVLKNLLFVAADLLAVESGGLDLKYGIFRQVQRGPS